MEHVTKKQHTSLQLSGATYKSEPSENPSVGKKG